jgi:hypothetical protein
MTRPFAILVPWDEVLDRGYVEKGDVVWTKPPAKGMCIEYDVLYAAAGLTVTGHPGARSMNTELIGKVDLANGEQVFVVSRERPMDEATRRQVDRLRDARIIDAQGNQIPKLGMLAFGVEQDGVGTFLDVTRPNTNVTA